MFSKRLMAKEPPPPKWFHLKNDNHLEKTWEDFRNLILFMIDSQRGRILLRGNNPKVCILTYIIFLDMSIHIRMYIYPFKQSFFKIESI